MHLAGDRQATKNIKNTVDKNGHANIERVWHKRSPCLSQRLRRRRRPALPLIAPWGSRRASRRPTSQTKRIMPKQSPRKIRSSRLSTTTPSGRSKPSPPLAVAAPSPRCPKPCRPDPSPPQALAAPSPCRPDPSPPQALAAKSFGAYDSDNLQPSLSRRLSAWYTQFPPSAAHPP